MRPFAASETRNFSYEVLNLARACLKALTLTLSRIATSLRKKNVSVRNTLPAATEAAAQRSTNADFAEVSRPRDVTGRCKSTAGTSVGVAASWVDVTASDNASASSSGGADEAVDAALEASRISSFRMGNSCAPSLLSSSGDGVGVMGTSRSVDMVTNATSVNGNAYLRGPSNVGGEGLGAASARETTSAWPAASQRRSIAGAGASSGCDASSRAAA